MGNICFAFLPFFLLLCWWHVLQVLWVRGATFLENLTHGQILNDDKIICSCKTDKQYKHEEPEFHSFLASNHAILLFPDHKFVVVVQRQHRFHSCKCGIGSIWRFLGSRLGSRESNAKNWRQTQHIPLLSFVSPTMVCNRSSRHREFLCGRKRHEFLNNDL